MHNIRQEITFYTVELLQRCNETKDAPFQGLKNKLKFIKEDQLLEKKKSLVSKRTVDIKIGFFVVLDDRVRRHRLNRR